ncbi:biotin-dependent carboxyltransferase family protein [Azorhizobium doebereinerae]|uniref:5-oxoprolinase subunit C family protein n=1 Tax=Azorhizobium doebereinerae TaxID=281091 RepID=UPI0003F73F90|nr:biotin-dependent carboxyltransferase family protein [Azorhizobium doebereinerae]
MSGSERTAPDQGATGALRILSAGPGVTIQDAGRHGLLRFGVTGAGPMDPLAFALANRVAQVPDGSAALEISMGGVELEAADAPVTVALAGGDFRVTLDGQAMPAAARLTLEPGARLAVKAGASGAWCYLAPAARIDIAPTLGSLSTHARSGIGGLNGRALAAGDVLPLADPRVLPGGAMELSAPALVRPGEVIRVLLGPQDDYFSPAEIAAFLAGPWTVSVRSDRMAYFLDGTPMTHAGGFNIVSDGIAHGAIQVPGEGYPVVLMGDRQPTGGYPKIANVIGADLGRIAQLRPGSVFRFAAVSLEEAVEARRAEAAAVADGWSLAPLVRTNLSSEFLLGCRLVDGWVDAFAEW